MAASFPHTKSFLFNFFGSATGFTAGLALSGGNPMIAALAACLACCATFKGDNFEASANGATLGVVASTLLAITAVEHLAAGAEKHPRHNTSMESVISDLCPPYTRNYKHCPLYP